MVEAIRLLASLLTLTPDGAHHCAQHRADSPTRSNRNRRFSLNPTLYSCNLEQQILAEPLFSHCALYASIEYEFPLTTGTQQPACNLTVSKQLVRLTRPTVTVQIARYGGHLIANDMQFIHNHRPLLACIIHSCCVLLLHVLLGQATCSISACLIPTAVMSGSGSSSSASFGEEFKFARATWRRQAASKKENEVCAPFTVTVGVYRLRR